MKPFDTAPELDVTQWFNASEPVTLTSLRGKVVVLHAFQMLCPGCVHSGIPQAQRIAANFPRSDVAVIGVHTVFEHHQAMTPISLAAFIHEYRLTFPIAVDRPGGKGPIPATMAALRDARNPQSCSHRSRGQGSPPCLRRGRRSPRRCGNRLVDGRGPTGGCRHTLASSTRSAILGQLRLAALCLCDALGRWRGDKHLISGILNTS